MTIYDTYYHSDYVREYTYEDFEEITFDHTDMFILNPHKREMQLRKEYSLIYSTIMIAWCVYVVSSFFAAHSMEFRRTVNYYLDTYVYETDGEDSESGETRWGQQRYIYGAESYRKRMAELKRQKK